MPQWERILTHAGSVLGESLQPGAVRTVGGGCINAAYVVDAGPRSFFIKLNGAEALAMFEAEAEGLVAIAESHSIRVPQPLCFGVAGSDAYLVMEYLPLGGRGKAEQLGEDLASMHRCQQPRFGWHRDNTIGSTAQYNDWCEDWLQFWREQRLGAQLSLAAHNGAGAKLLRKGEQLQHSLSALFTDYRPVPSLLHGDLWSGNYAFDDTGRPVIFDPAVYFGDREADLAMTELFGGFPAGFYAAYQAAWPLDAGYGARKTLYNLYHILNHFNLFGGGYLAQAEGLMDRLLSECR
jgi:fructosamine-3-kinase